MKAGLAGAAKPLGLPLARALAPLHQDAPLLDLGPKGLALSASLIAGLRPGFFERAASL